MAKPEEDPYIGKTFDGRYHLLDLLGVGTTGSVYRARQVNVSRDVAVKILTPDPSHADACARRFRVEASVISQLRHPNTLKLIDFGRVPQGPLYFVTEYLRGATLEALLYRDGPMPPRRALEMLRQISDALVEAHAAGVVHRDLKPANIMIERIGDQDMIKVLDFGLAKVAEVAAITVQGTVVGSPAYMSPEQAQGRPVDGRSDLYSLGAIAYECIAGRQPFMGSTPYAVLRQHIDSRPPALPPGDDTAFDRALASCVMGLLEKNPDDRPADAAELRAHLDRLMKWPTKPVTRSEGPFDDDEFEPAEPAWSRPLGLPPVTDPATSFGDEDVTPGLSVFAVRASGRHRRGRRRMRALLSLLLLTAAAAASWYFRVGPLAARRSETGPSIDWRSQATLDRYRVAVVRGEVSGTLVDPVIRSPIVSPGPGD